MTRRKFDNDEERRAARAEMRHRSYLLSKGEEVEPTPTEKWCPRCRVHWRYKGRRELRAPTFPLTAGQFGWLEIAAATFVEEAEAHPDREPYTVEEFVAWIKPEFVRAA